MTINIAILNGRLTTFDADNPTAEALAISDNRIAAVGTTAEIRAIAGPDTMIVDAEGGTVSPGLIDSHVHLFPGSAELDCLNIHGLQGGDALARQIRPHAAERPDDPMIVCVGAGYDFLGPQQSATRHDLDLILPDRPLAFVAADHHTVWTNTLALDKAGILHGGETPPGSEIVLGSDGLASGQLKEPAAYGPLMRVSRYGGRDMLGLTAGRDPDPAPTAAERALDKEVLVKGMQYCASQGITGLHNMDGNLYQLELLHELEQEGRMSCRVQIPLHFTNRDRIERLDEAAEMRRRFASDMLWSGRVKLFCDGVLDNYTAYCLEPYPCRPGHRGQPLFEQDFLNEICVRADGMGLQISVHAIGDGAVRSTLDAFEAARDANGTRDSRHRIEHVEIAHPDDLKRFAELGVVASMQPLHSPTAGYWPPYRFGDVLRPEHAGNAFAWRKLRELGVPLVFSTDWPIVPLPPMRSIEAGVRAEFVSDEWPDQTLPLREVLAAYSSRNAWVEFSEHEKGKLKRDYLADVTVLGTDIENTAADALRNVPIAATVCDGRLTHRA